MAGREGLIDTAVKTSRSGYLQRCLIKHMEDIHVQHDLTVRNSEGSIVQFYYGEDSLDVSKHAFLQDPIRLNTLANNISCLVQRHNPKNCLDRLDTISAVKYINSFQDTTLPIMEMHSPAICLGSVSELFSKRIEMYLEEIDQIQKQAKESSILYECKELLLASKNATGKIPDIRKIRALLWLKYMRSLVEPGEAVGILASQSIGEPSTQMTLNTFHLAGFGAQNVTLGIPRLREIIMVASKKIKTPTMSIPFTSRMNDKKKAGRLVQQFNRLSMSELVYQLHIKESFRHSDELITVMNIDKAGGNGWKQYNQVVLELDPAIVCARKDIQDYLKKQFVLDFTDGLRYVLAGGRLSFNTINTSSSIQSGNADDGEDEEGWDDPKMQKETDDTITETHAAKMVKINSEKRRKRRNAKVKGQDDILIQVNIKEVKTKGHIVVTIHMPPMDTDATLLTDAIEQVLDHCVILKIKGVKKCLLIEQSQAGNSGGRPRLA